MPIFLEYTTQSKPSKPYRNRGANFADVTKHAGLENEDYVMGLLRAIGTMTVGPIFQ
ncbi:MAG: hypothetical protein U0905_06140 [Pirellulales bacterium]